MRRDVLAGALLLHGLVASPAWSEAPPGGGSPELLVDLSIGISDALVATSFASDASGTVYFTGCDEAHGCELWRTDGTEDGTRLIRDTMPGPCFDALFNSCPDPSAARVQSLDGRVLLSEGRYRSHQVGDMGSYFRLGPLYRVDEGDALSLLPGVEVQPFTRAVTFAGSLYFLGARPLPEDVNALPDYGLYRTDGTEAGTSRLGFATPSGLVATPHHLYFLDKDTLKRTDGTEAGTESVLPLALSSPQLLRAMTGSDGQELLLLLTAFGRLTVTDGTWAGTRVVADLGFTSRVGSPTVVGDLVYFEGQDREHGRELWRTDGTAAGTVCLDLVPGDRSSTPSDLTAIGSGLAVVAWDETGGQAVYRLDPSSREPRRLTPLSTRPHRVSGLCLVGDTLWFSLTSTGSALDFEAGIWTSDGTPEGTRLAVTGRRGKSSDAIPHVALGRRLLLGRPARYPFGYDQRPALYALESRETSALGARRLRPLLRLEGPGWIRVLSAATATHAVLRVTDCSGGPCREEVWGTDGTAEGTARILDLGRELDAPFESAVVGGNRIVFVGRDLEHGTEPFVTDGTPGGTRLLADLTPGPSDSTVSSIVTAGSRALVVVSSRTVAERDRRVYSTDGSPAGTDLLTTSGWDPPIPTGSGAVLLNQVVRDPNGRPLSSEIWRTDGTSEGTFRLASGLSASTALSLNGGFLFTVKRPLETVPPQSYLPQSDQDLLFVPDRPDGGASPIHPHSGGLEGAVKAQALLVRDLDAFHFQLLATDGTAAGTRDLGTFGRAEPADRLGSPESESRLVVASGLAYFSAATPEGGLELWRTDATPEGTARVADIAPGPASSWPRHLLTWDGLLVFSADDGARGREVWGLPLNATDGSDVER